MTTRESTVREMTVESVRELESETGELNGNQAVSGQTEDIEKGFPNEEDTGIKVHEEAQLEVLECTGEHTHILVPLPGQTNNEEAKLETPLEPAPKSTWQSSLSKIKSPQDKPSSSDKSAAEADNKESTITERAVPIFCAVCLMEYEVSDRVCWSSNKECTHVFHEDCIVQWLVSSGRTKSKRRWFPENPSEKRLMCYELECPCCRQEFISKEAKAESSAEENV